MSTMMHVYFDITGEIKAISPVIDATNTNNTALFPLDDVHEFLISRRNPGDYFVESRTEGDKTEYKIIRKKSLEINFVRTLENFLSEINESIPINQTIISVENFITLKSIRIRIHPLLGLLHSDGTDEERHAITIFINTPQSFLFFTKKNDPHFLIHTVAFEPCRLYKDGTVYIPYKEDLADTSVFTRKILNGYSYSIIKE